MEIENVREMEAGNARERTTLVLGGRGKTGRRVVERLEARGLPVRVGSRSGEPPFDWENPDTWAPALEGVESVYVSYYPDIAIGRRLVCEGEMQNLTKEVSMRDATDKNEVTEEKDGRTPSRAGDS